jgi:hypothetical protein
VIRSFLVLVPALLLLLALAACPTQPAGDDDTSTLDDDDIWPDDDDSADDDDSVDDDDSGAAPECVDDGMEDNDDETLATPVVPGAYPGLVACPEDEDWFVVALELGEHLQVDLSFAHTEGDIDLLIHGPGGDQLAQGTSVTDDESAGATAMEAGAYTIVVYTVDELGSDYAMTVAVGEPPECPVDVLEENDGVDAPGTPGPGTWTALTVCKDDEDWYRFSLAVDQVLDVTVTFLTDEGDIDLELYDAAAALVDDSGGIVDIEEISFTATGAGNYDLRVFLYESEEAWQNTYDLTVAIQ